MTTTYRDMNILLVGGYPPPIGGISIHIQRLSLYLRSLGCQVHVLDYLSSGGTYKDSQVTTLPANLWDRILTLFSLAAATPVDAIVHFHISAMGRFKWLVPLLLFLFRHQSRVLTIHSGSFVRAVDQRWMRHYLRALLLMFRQIITVSAEQKEFLVGLGMPAEHVQIIPAFLPQTPQPSQMPAKILSQFPKKKIVLTSGYLTPLYNYDVLIDCVSRLTSSYAFVFAFYNAIDPKYEAHISRRLAEFQNVVILRDQPPNDFLSILAACDIYVRATLTDGDSITIREALDLGKRVFASNVVVRPDQCVLFPPDDPDSLMSLFEQPPPVNATPQSVEHNGQLIAKIYEEIVRKG